MSEKQDRVLQKLHALPIDLSLIELFPSEEGDAYFCTPLGARILGRLGVDGIHFCDVPALGRDLVFAISPMGDPPFIFPVAEDLTDFLAEIYTCGSAGSIEQLVSLNPTRAADFLYFNRVLCTETDQVELRRACQYFGMDDQMTPDVERNRSTANALDVLAKEFSLKPIENIHAHILSVCSSFDIKTLSFPDEYYNY